jgi:hypothetical protein
MHCQTKTGWKIKMMVRGREQEMLREIGEVKKCLRHSEKKTN